MDNKTIVITVGTLIAVLVIGFSIITENALERRSAAETKEAIELVSSSLNIPIWIILLAAVILALIVIIVTHSHFFVYEVHKIEARFE